MAQKVFQNPLTISIAPEISALDVYADGDAFGAVIDVTSQIKALKPNSTDVFDTFAEIDSIIVTDMDNQQASYDVYFKCENFTVDIADNDSFAPAGSDVPGLIGPLICSAGGNYTEMPVGAAISAKGLFTVQKRVPLTGSKVLVKVVIRSASTFQSTSSVSFKITGHHNG